MFRFLWKKIKQILRWFRRLGIVQILTIILIIVVLLIIISVLSKNNDEISNDNIRVVDIRSVATLSSNREPLFLIGRVESTSEADIRAEAQGEITQVYSRLGDAVFAGQILAETENSAQRATLLQAQGILEAAEANLAKLISGSRSEEKDIMSLSVAEAEERLEQSKISAINAISNAFALTDEAVFNKADDMFNGARTTSPKLRFSVPISQLTRDVESGRLSIGAMIERWEKSVRLINEDSNLTNELKNANSNLVSLRDFLDNLSRAASLAEETANISATTISTWRTNMLVARSSINGTITALTAEINGLNSINTGLEVARKNQEIGIIGGRSEDVLVAEAVVKQAQGSLAGARAAFEKTRIRTPISGTLNSFPIKKGGFISMFEPAAIVSNNNTLNITTFITEDDKEQILKGAQALLDGRYRGVVTNVAPALDPITKKIEVTIAPKVNMDKFVNGESVRVEIERNISVEEFDKNAPITIPISALKIEPDRNIVFSVTNKNTLMAHSVTLGPIIGEKVIIAEGLDANIFIVIDARGLKEGQLVEVR